MSVPRKVAEYSGRVATDLRAVLADDLVGVYLHGSGAMGGWHPLQSDVDLLAVAQRPLTVAEKSAVADNLSSLPAPGAGLEFSLVTTRSVEAGGLAPDFELHVTTGENAKMIDGGSRRGDPDLVMHFAMCRARGVAVYGPEAEDVFPEVSREGTIAYLANELLWGLEEAPPRYAVLNACRAWAFVEEGRLLSKMEGGEWALTGYPSPEVVRAALASQRGDSVEFDSEAVDRLVRLVHARLVDELERR